MQRATVAVFIQQAPRAVLSAHCHLSQHQA